MDNEEIILSATNEDMNILYSIINEWSIGLYLHIKNETKIDNNRKRVHIIGEKEGISLLRNKIKEMSSGLSYNIME